jgi:putative acetyltransferase
MLLPGVHLLRPPDFPRLVEVWEASVRATHDFVAEEDILAYQRMVQAGLPYVKNLLGVRGPGQEAVGFMAVEGDKLEMLFVHPDWRGAGVGRRLVEYAVGELGVRAVDVNEQNEQAVGFYLKMGFEVAGSSALDGTGKPYPLLHLRLASATPEPHG